MATPIAVSIATLIIGAVMCYFDVKISIVDDPRAQSLPGEVGGD